MKVANWLYDEPGYGPTVKRISALKLPLGDALAINTLLCQLKKKHVDYEGKRKELILKYGTLNADQKTTTVRGENVRLFTEAYDKLALEEHEIGDVLLPVPSELAEAVTPAEAAVVVRLFACEHKEIDSSLAETDRSSWGLWSGA